MYLEFKSNKGTLYYYKKIPRSGFIQVFNFAMKPGKDVIILSDSDKYEFALYAGDKKIYVWQASNAHPTYEFKNVEQFADFLVSEDILLADKKICQCNIRSLWINGHEEGCVEL